MDWDKIRMFEAVTKARSFTRAGDVLGLSQSAVSRQISALERELGAPLFHRHARGLVPTEHGELLFKAAEDMRVRLETTRARMTETSEVPAGPLRVSATVGFGGMWLSRQIAEFLDRYPDVRIELILSTGELDVAMREADVAIRLRRPEQQDVIQRRLFSVHHHAYASREYVERFGEPLSAADLDNHRIVCLGGDQPAFIMDVHILAALGRPAGNPRPNVVVVNDSVALRQAVRSGAGIGIIPDYAIEVRSGLVHVLRDVEVPALDAYLVYPEEMRAVARLQVFRDFLVSKAQRWSY